MFLLLQKVEISTAKTDMISSLIKKREKTTTTNTHLQSKKSITYISHMLHQYVTYTPPSPTLRTMSNRVLLPKTRKNIINSGTHKLCTMHTLLHVLNHTTTTKHQQNRHQHQVRCKNFCIWSIFEFLRINNKVTNLVLKFSTTIYLHKALWSD